MSFFSRRAEKKPNPFMLDKCNEILELMLRKEPEGKAIEVAWPEEKISSMAIGHIFSFMGKHKGEVDVQEITVPVSYDAKNFSQVERQLDKLFTAHLEKLANERTIAQSLSAEGDLPTVIHLTHLAGSFGFAAEKNGSRLAQVTFRVPDALHLKSSPDMREMLRAMRDANMDMLNEYKQQGTQLARR